MFGKGLGELYEEEYVRAARPDGDVLEERDAATKAEARTLLKVGSNDLAAATLRAGRIAYNVLRMSFQHVRDSSRYCANAEACQSL